MVYFDIDLDANGCKTYDLGGQSAKAVFQPADGLMIEKPSRYANHVIATLDKIVVDEWIMEDNVSISDFLPEFTYPQIMEFVELAQDANSTNVLAILLDYLDKAKDDYGLMDESEPS